VRKSGQAANRISRSASRSPFRPPIVSQVGIPDAGVVGVSVISSPSCGQAVRGSAGHTSVLGGGVQLGDHCRAAAGSAAVLRRREPLLVPGLLQTPEYARGLFRAWRTNDDQHKVGQLVTARMERQRIFGRQNRRLSSVCCCRQVSAQKFPFRTKVGI
jgi:hypothetical protein